MTAELSEIDRTHLERAVSIADRGWGRVHPNPLVGCVVVQGDEVVAEGWHAEYGGPHAEVMALDLAGERARGATAYVSLEPCRHEGRTPPCTGALRRAGVARVVFGAADPGAESGGGANELREAGIEVIGPVLDERRSRALNPAFHHRFRHDRPWVSLKLAASLDGGIARRPGEQSWLTGSEAAAEVHRLRAAADGIVVGAVTARVDDPRLTVRGSFTPRVPPVRIVIDPRATLPLDGALMRSAGEVPVWVFVGADAAEAAVAGLEGAGATVIPVPASGPGALDLHEVLRCCGERGLSALFCEGGGRLGAALARADLLDRLYLLLAPRFLGPETVPAFPEWPSSGPASADGGSGWLPAAPPRRLGVDTLLAFDRNRELD